jgi:hypothetical protein
MFTEEKIKQIRHLLNFPIEELKPGSYLRKRIAFVEKFDLDNGTNIEAKIQEWLSEIGNLEESISAYETAAAEGQYKKVEMDNEFNVEFFEQKQSASELRKKRNNLIACIIRDLGLKINTNVRRVVR